MSTDAARVPARGTPLLVAEHMTKSFPGVLALDDVSFSVRTGEVNALVGENGAGKSTLIKLMAGFYAPDQGSIVVGGRDLVADPAAAHAAGIATIHQDHHLVPAMSVAENILLGRWPSRLGIIDRRQQRRKAIDALAQVAPNLSPDEIAGRLSPAEGQLVEIARALAEESRVLIMDEPTASLSPREVDSLFRVVRDLRAKGLGIVFVSHWLEEVFAIADRITVLRDGKLVGSRPAAELDQDQVIRMTVGRHVETVTTRSVHPGKTILDVRGLCRNGVLDGITFQVRENEIVTLAGLVGAGRSEVAGCIFGIDRYDAGEILIDGKPAPAGDPRAAIAAGIALIPEERRKQALVGQLSVAANVSLAVLDRIAPLGILDRNREMAVARRAIDSLGIRAASASVPVATLSGGNQQKVVLDRWLAREPRLLILDEPTKGVDVGAKAEISQIIVELAAKGTAILLISSELPEVLALSDRVLVMRSGRIVAELPRAGLSSEAIMNAATVG